MPVEAYPSDSLNGHTQNGVAVVDVVIVNWNSGDWLRKCMQSLQAFGQKTISSITVVDNGSVDGSDKHSIVGLPLEVIQTYENLGFGRACNLGVAKGQAPYILFLNPDAALYEATLDIAVAFMEVPANAVYGVCGIRLEEEIGETQKYKVRFPTVGRMIATAFGIIQLFPKAVFHDRGFDHLHSRDVDHVIGAFYLIRRDLFESLGGFDPRFFVYLEDLDLSLRVSHAGYRVRYLAEAVGFHKGGGTSNQVRAHRLYYSLDSRLFYAFKHFSGFSAWLIASATLLVEPIPRLAQAMVRISPIEAKNTLRAFAWLWKGFLKNPRRFRLTQLADRTDKDLL
jgi:N-acetylglucosaminyl-diphospho-decaprenol L-rhamnosyltransferase